MPLIKYFYADGACVEGDVPIGSTIMEGAMRFGVEGIVAECGGACSCATCHVYVDKAWTDKIPAANPAEVAMLEFAEGREENSRLSCQIRITDDMAGFAVTVAAEE